MSHLRSLICTLALIAVCITSAAIAQERPMKLSEMQKLKSDSAAADQDFERWPGVFRGGRRVELTVDVVDGSPVLTLPGKPPYTLQPPDASGRWFFEESSDAWATFETTDDGILTMVTLFSGAELLRIEDPTTIPADTTDPNLAAIMGSYKFPGDDRQFGIVAVSEGLGLRMPKGDMSVQLIGPDSTGMLVGILDNFTRVELTFDRDGNAPASTMHLVNVSSFERLPME